MEKMHAFSHAPIDFHFSQTPSDFVVEEVPLYEFSNEGEHRILYVRKKGLGTLEMLKTFSSALGCKLSDVGYCGLKDKSALTYQYLSINKAFLKNLESAQNALEEKNVKILSMTSHDNKLKIGHLKGNRFFVRLKKVTPANFNKIQSVLQTILNVGLPNYFGYQRFGRDGENHLEGEKIAKGELKMRDKKLSAFLVSSYQSFLFNQWLAFRIKISRVFESFEVNEIKKVLQNENLVLDLQTIKAIKSQSNFFKLFEGDVLSHYPHGKLFITENLMDESKRFFAKDVSPTGLLSGTKTLRGEKFASEIEGRFDDKAVTKAMGGRRFAWIWPQDVKCRYAEENAWAELEFFLPKGSYATTLIEELAHRSIKID